MKSKAALAVFMLILILIVSGCAPSTNSNAEEEAMSTEESLTSESVDTNKDTMNEESEVDEAMTDASVSVSDDTTEGDELPDMTLDELSHFNGKNGQPVYVAVDGIVYDVSHLDKWKTGQHMGQHDAGQDLSEAILKSPHGKKILERAIPVAKLVE